jgi:hypothetical protein
MGGQEKCIVICKSLFATRVAIQMLDSENTFFMPNVVYELTNYVEQGFLW